MRLPLCQACHQLRSRPKSKTHLDATLNSKQNGLRLRAWMAKSFSGEPCAPGRKRDEAENAAWRAPGVRDVELEVRTSSATAWPRRGRMCAFAVDSSRVWR